MKIVDAFVFYNELDMLQYRLETLDPYVDHFVLVEATHTHTGIPKPLHFEENKHTFAKFLHKLVHVVVDDFPYKEHVSDGRQWRNESFQRECGVPRGLQKIPNIDLDDYVVNSDLDEIVNPEVLQNIREGKIAGDCHTLEMDFYYYNMTNYLGKWHAPCVTKVGFSMKTSGRWSCQDVIPNAGWHLSYFGDYAFIRNKLEHFGHQEYNTERFKSADNINAAIKKGRDLFNRGNVTITKIRVCDNPCLPPRMDLLTRFWEGIQ